MPTSAHGLECKKKKKKKKKLKETKFLLPLSEMIERSEVKHSVASFLDVSNSCRFCCLLKDVDKRRGIVQSGVISIGVDRTVCQGKKIIDE